MRNDPTDMFLVINRGNGNSYRLPRARVEVMIARGDADYATDGTRRVYVRHTNARQLRREWRKTASRDPQTGASVSVMQLVPVAESAAYRRLVRRSGKV